MSPQNTPSQNTLPQYGHNPWWFTCAGNARVNRLPSRHRGSNIAQRVLPDRRCAVLRPRRRIQAFPRSSSTQRAIGRADQRAPTLKESQQVSCRSPRMIARLIHGEDRGDGTLCGRRLRQTARKCRMSQTSLPKGEDRYKNICRDETKPTTCRRLGIRRLVVGLEVLVGLSRANC